MDDLAPLQRIRSEGRDLMNNWFDDLKRADENGEPVANVFVMGNCLELLQAFDVHLVFPEILSLQTAVRKVSSEYIRAAEGWGMSTDACNYVKADIGLALDGMEHPSGKIPKPSLAVASNMCLVFTKWAEIWERMHDVPIQVLDIPLGRARGRKLESGEERFESDKEYVLEQLWELVELLEEVTGRDFDPSKLSEAERQANRMMRAWRGILEVNRNQPAVYDALADGVVFLGIANILRGTEEGADFMELAEEQLQHAADESIGALNREKHRLLFHGVACYPYMRRFQALFHSWNGVFVTSPYLSFACGGFTGEELFDPSRPMESLAEMTVTCNRQAHQAMYYTDDYLFDRDILDEFHVDGVVFHVVKSCRTVSTSHANTRQFLMERDDIPCLLLESDHVDPRYFSEAQLKNRADAFFESLEQKKYHAEEKEGTRESTSAGG